MGVLAPICHTALRVLICNGAMIASGHDGGEQSRVRKQEVGGELRKQAVSIRLNRADVRHIKRLADRLGVRDSDVIRFAIKLMFARLTPLQDASAGGRGLVPVLLESGSELMRYFELDAGRLAAIVNEGVDPELRVDAEDIQLIAMSDTQRSYVLSRVAGMRRTQAGIQANGESGAKGAAHPLRNVQSGGENLLEHSLREYLYDKYLFSDTPNPAMAASNPKQGGDQ
jgi:hypothetical protein